MRPGAQIKAAADVLDDILNRHRTAADALADWGRSHRFAGSGDRAAIGNLVYDALRRRRSLSAKMSNDTPRALALAAASQALGIPAEAVIAAAEDAATPHAMGALNEDERSGIVRELDSGTPAAVLGDVPDWLLPSFERAFGSAAADEGAALARRAPVDLRVNTLKADRAKVMKALARFAPSETPLSPVGVRLAPPSGPRRPPNVEADTGHGRGWFEIQDEGSQVAALLAGVGPRQQVLDI
jgi:16S rRNA (cytosine967-C5)-methyltransferase